METVLIDSPIGVLAVLCAVAAFFFLLAQVTDTKLFKYVPPLLFIYATPVFLSNLAIGGQTVIPNSSIIYTGLSKFALPRRILPPQMSLLALARASGTSPSPHELTAKPQTFP